MSIDLVLLEKFIVEMSAPASKIGTHQFFKSLTENPVKVFHIGIPRMSHLLQQNPSQSAEYTHSLLFGVALTVASKNSDMAKELTNYLEYKKRERGENVVDFLQWNVDKGNA